jgi:hypothetical protein
MKKQIFLTSAMAATLSGCSSGDDWDGNVYARNDTRVCVDQNGYRADDSYCSRGSAYYGGSRWYYVGRGARIPYHGDSVNDRKLGFTGGYDAKPGASYASAPSDANMTRSAARSRGGFGSSSRSFGGGRS